jgi:hypothetical protein
MVEFLAPARLLPVAFVAPAGELLMLTVAFSGVIAS